MTTVRVYVDNKGCRYEVAHTGAPYTWVRRSGAITLDFGRGAIPLDTATRTLKDVTPS